MIIGVDIGGTKTLIGVFDRSGKLMDEVRFDTDPNYEKFLEDLKRQAGKLELSTTAIATVAIPGLLDRRQGKLISLGNLPWQDRHIQHDAARALGVQKVYIENDSKLAGLAEARYVLSRYKRTFYLTISTGINGALVVNGKLATILKDMEIGKIPLEYRGAITAWEDFSSGRAFVEAYGQKAVDVKDTTIWKEYASTLNYGIGIICATFQPEAIIFGGGLGQHVSRFKEYIPGYLQQRLHPNVRQPSALLSTHYRGQSVIYGCYEYGQDHLT